MQPVKLRGNLRTILIYGDSVVAPLQHASFQYPAKVDYRIDRGLEAAQEEHIIRTIQEYPAHVPVFLVLHLGAFNLLSLKPKPETPDQLSGRFGRLLSQLEPFRNVAVIILSPLPRGEKKDPDEKLLAAYESLRKFSVKCTHVTVVDTHARFTIKGTLDRPYVQNPALFNDDV